MKSCPDKPAGGARQPVTRLAGYGLIVALVLGIGLRLYPSASFQGVGFDEQLYQYYVTQLNAVGLARFPELVADYIDTQREMTSAILPPTRFLYIFCGHLWSAGLGVEPLRALHDVSTLFSILTLLLTAWFTWRLGGPTIAAGVTLLMACAPTQIHMSQHALIDGFFGFWALLGLVALWSVLRQPGGIRRPALLTAAVAATILTKENAFFVCVGLGAVTVAGPLLGYGRWRWPVIAALAAGAIFGAGLLIALAGGISPLIETYSLLVENAYALEYAIRTGDGPWFRYVIDLMLVAPVVMLLAIGGLFRLSRRDRDGLFLAGFILVTYVLMSSVRYGMNLRYANLWDMPIRYFAMLQIIWLTGRLPAHKDAVIVLLTLGTALHQLALYIRLAVGYPLYELVTSDLLRALMILK